MHLILFLLGLLRISAAPLQQSSFVTLRTTAPPPSGGGNLAPSLYRELVLEEWATSPPQLLQSWPVPCSLPALSNELWTEGRLSPRYPWGDQVWFLCRNVPINSSLSYSPAPVDSMVLSEDGTLSTWVEEPLYPNGTNVVNIIPYWDEAQSLTIFYLLGGGTVANGPANPAKPAQPRIRVDTGPGQPPDAQGALLASTQGVTINQLRILNGTLYGAGLFGGSTGIPSPTIFQIGAEGVLPTGTRNPTTQIPNFPLILSSWTDPFSGKWWRTGLNRTAYLALHNNADGSDLVFGLPPAASAGTLGGASWSVATARYESADFSVYLTNTTHIVKNTLNGLQNGLPYQPVLQAPSGWRYLSAHARNPNLPTPSATATATATSTSSASATASASASASATSTVTSSASASSTPSPSSQPTSSASPSASASASSHPSATATASRDPQISSGPSASSTPSPSLTPSTTPSNGSFPIPPDSNQATTDELSPGAQTGIGLASVAAFCIAGLLMIKYTPALQRLYIQQFGSSMKSAKKGVSFRKPVSTDVPITISHNPQALVQHRLEQLKDLQKQMSARDATQATHSTLTLDRTKKEFGPTVTGESV